MFARYPVVLLALAWLGPSSAPAPSAGPPVYQLTTVAGSDLTGDGGAALTAQVAQPEGIVLDPAGNLFIADAANHRVRKVTPGGTISTVAGNGHAGFSGDGGPAAAAQPYDVALDPAGTLYIADYGNQRVRAVGTDGNITTVAGSPGGKSGDSGPAAGARLLGPRNVATDAAGNLYISEFDGHRVRQVRPDGAIYTIAGTGVAGFNGDGGAAGAAQLASPAGLAFDGAGNLFIVDSGNVRIRKVAAGTGTIGTILTLQSFALQYVQLSGLAASRSGNLYIPDSINSYVWQLTPAGVITRVAGAAGSGASGADGQPAIQTALAAPVAVTLDAGGDLYISEARRVRTVTAATGIVTTVAGTGAFGFGGDGGDPLAAVLNAPAGLVFGNGSLYIADQNNNRVRVIAGGIISTLAGDGTASYGGDGLAAAGAGLNGPQGLTLDPAGNLYIADALNGRVRRMDSAGVITTFAGNGISAGFGGEGDPATLTPLSVPQGVAADSTGNIFVADTGHHRVLRVDTAGNMHTVAGTGSPGDSNGGGGSLAEVNGPAGLAVDTAGNLYIADAGNHRIRLLGADGSLSTVAGAGTDGFSGDGGPAAAAQLSSPAAVAVDAAGNLFIADTGNHRVRMVTTAGTIFTIAGTGDGSYNGDSGAALKIALDHPAGLALDGQGNLWVADTGNNRVRMLAPGPIAPPPQLVSVALTNAASLLPGPLAPGEIFSIFGQGMGPDQAAMGGFDASGSLSTSLDGVAVLVNGTPAPLFYAQANQINAQMPYEVAGQTFAQLQILYQGAVVATTQVSIVEANPALFTLGNGAGNAVVINQDGTINSDQHPAPRGSIVVLYATGEGQTSPGGATGRGAVNPFPSPLGAVSLTLAGIPASIIFAGEAPGFVGVMQINAQVPTGFIPGGDLAVVLSVGTCQSPAGVSIAVE